MSEGHNIFEVKKRLFAAGGCQSSWQHFKSPHKKLAFYTQIMRAAAAVDADADAAADAATI